MRKKKPHKIAWTDETWNPVWGCYANCHYCYARSFSKRFAKPTANNEVKNDITLANLKDKQNKYFEILHRLQKFEPVFLVKQFNNYEKKFKGQSKKIFVGSMTDIAFWLDEWVDIVLNKIKEYPEHTFQILTKYPEKIQHIEFPQNVWLGITAENQTKFNDRMKNLIPIKAGKKFVSLEPLLDKIKIDEYLLTDKKGEYPFRYLQSKHRTRYTDFIDWVIIGGQTGINAVEMEQKWVLPIINTCRNYGIPVFFKNWGTGGHLRGDTVGWRTYKEFPENNKNNDND